jgi:ABC-2 type transport system permease protein
MWDGERESPLTRWSVISEAGIRLSWRIMWLRRVVFLAFSPILVFGALFYVFEMQFENDQWRPFLNNQQLQGWFPYLGQLASEVNESSDPSVARHAIWAILLHSYFTIPQATGMVIIVAVIAPKLISQDLRTRAILLYFSRPIATWEYIVGKMAIVWFYLMCVTALPALTVYLLGVSMAPDLSVLSDTWDLPFRCIIAALILIIPATSVAVCFSSMTQESRFAGFAWLALWLVGTASYNILLLTSQAGLTNVASAPVGYDAQYAQVQFEDAQIAYETASDRWSTISPFHCIGRIQRLVFFGLDTATFHDWVRVFLVTFVTIICQLTTVRRVRRPLQI